MNCKLWFALGAASLCAAQATACASDFASCRERRTCIGGGAGGLGEAGQAPGAAGDVSSNAGQGGGDAAGDPGNGGEGGGPSVPPALFGACSGGGQIACEGTASAQRLACDGSKWQAGTTCASEQLCNSEDGKCLPKVEECADAQSGQIVCRKDAPLTCGPDLVTAELGDPCLGACKDGVCVAPACGDGKIQDGEGCDDGNLLPGDGCSSKCAPEPIALALGNGFSCALGSNGAVMCWGNNALGQLGSDSGYDKDQNGSKPLRVSLGAKRTAKAVSAGGDSACALLDDNSVKCWGRNDRGQLGTGDLNNRGDAAREMGDKLKPIDLGTGSSARSITINRDHACAVLDNGALKCWGSNQGGDLGQDDQVDYAEPGALSPINLGTGRTAKAVSTSAFDFTCTLLDNGLLKCWGDNSFGQLCAWIDPELSRGVGNDPGEMSQLTGFAVAAGRTVKALATGERTACALLDDGSVKCWGENAYGEGGDSGFCFQPSTLNGYPFLDLGGNRKAKSISLTQGHSCVVLDDGSIRCFGINDSGQLGIGSTDRQGATPYQGVLQLKDVPLDRPALQVAVGLQHTCAILADGLVRC
ncbi:MAG: DUF4215 domain-containing protein, partial [Polyangiaceae bacterium]